ncbi:hypothetical protein ACTFIW_007764 [Dictyostelium discoideum]
MFLFSINSPQNQPNYNNDKFNDILIVYLIPTLIFLLSFFILICFRKNIRVQIIFIVYLIYRLTFVDNNFYLCTYNNNNNNNNSNNKINYKYFKLPNQCIHSSLLNTSKNILSHPNFCFNVPLGLSTNEENCNNNRICYKRRDDEGYNKFPPTFETDCGVELELDENTSSFYDLQQLREITKPKPTTTTTTTEKSNKFNYIITKPIVDNLDRDGYFIFMILYLIFMKEIIYNDNDNRNPLKKRIPSFIIFALFFSITSILFIAIKQKKDELIKVGTEDDELFLQSVKSELNRAN